MRQSIRTLLLLKDQAEEQKSLQFLKNWQHTLAERHSLSFADQIFIDQDIVESVQPAYRKRVNTIDLTNKANAIHLINTWISNNTNNAFQDLIRPDGIPDDLRMILIDVVLFQGIWKQKFNPDYIFKSKFNNFDGSSSIVEYLYTEVSSMNENESQHTVNYVNNGIHKIILYVLVSNRTATSMRPCNWEIFMFSWLESDIQLLI